MWIDLKGDMYNLIGDPHLGKEFRNGVPLDRRGQREADQFKQFYKELNKTKPGHVATIIMGDLLDRFSVGDNTKMKVYEAIASIAKICPDVKFIVIMGNHDCSRDTTEQSSFAVLSVMLKHLPNVEFVRGAIYWRPRIDKDSSVIMIAPYDEFTPTCDIKFRADPVDAVFGHWDTVSVGNDHNLIPLRKLCLITKQIYNGHVHTPSETHYHLDGSPMHHLDVKAGLPSVVLYNVGSMQPYSHGEDPNEQIYVTRTLEQFLDDPTIYHDKVLRLKLKKGQDVPTIDALQWSIQWEDEAVVETEVKMEEFSFEQLFKESLTAKGVAQNMVDTWWDKFVKGNGNDLNS